MKPRTCPHPTCGHEWTPRKANPKKCPQCQNPLWRSPRPKRKSIDPVLDAKPKSEDTPSIPSEAKATLTTEGRTGSANAPTGTDPECVREPIEKDSLSEMRAKAEELLRALA